MRTKQLTLKISLDVYVRVPFVTENEGTLKGGKPSLRWPVIDSWPVMFWLWRTATTPAAAITITALAAAKK